MADGADEVDMVIHVGLVKGGEWEAVQADIAAVVAASKPAIVKVILETCLLTDEEKVLACKAAQAAGAAFVKTSTGFSTGGATVEDIALMRKTVGPDMGVKASGGVRTREQAEAGVEKYRERYTDIGIGENKVYDGMLELLQDLQADKRRLGMATAKPEVFAVRIAERFGFNPFLEDITGASLDGKTDKKAINETIEKYPVGDNARFTYKTLTEAIDLLINFN